MTDEEFLAYCESHAETPRCGFVPKQIARLQRMAGYDKLAEQWEAEPNQVIDCDRNQIRQLIADARSRMADKGA